MPRPRFYNLDEDKRQRILSVAREEFAQHGFQGSSYNRIIKQCGLSKGVMYYYFDNKEDLYVTVITDAFEGMVEGLGEFPQVEDPASYWRAFGELSVAFFERIFSDPQLASLLRDLMHRSQSPASHALDVYTREWLQDYLKRGQEVGAVRVDLPDSLLLELVSHLLYAMDGWSLRQMEPGASGQLELSAEELSGLMDLGMDTLKRLLAPKVQFL